MSHDSDKGFVFPNVREIFISLDVVPAGMEGVSEVVNGFIVRNGQNGGLFILVSVLGLTIEEVSLGEVSDFVTVLFDYVKRVASDQ